MNLPNKIRIGPSWYNLTREDLTDLMGECDGAKNYIKLANNIENGKLASTLIHEVLHAILHEYYISLSEKSEEQVVRAIESGLSGFAKDNQKLFIDIIKTMGVKE